MLTSKVAYADGEPACNKALGDGYGLALFSDPQKPNAPRLAVMGLRCGVSGKVRPMQGFGSAAEIAFFNKNAVDVCSSLAQHLAAFPGTFVMALYD